MTRSGLQPFVKASQRDCLSRGAGIRSTPDGVGSETAPGAPGPVGPTQLEPHGRSAHEPPHRASLRSPSTNTGPRLILIFERGLKPGSFAKWTREVSGPLPAGVPGRPNCRDRQSSRSCCRSVMRSRKAMIGLCGGELPHGGRQPTHAHRLAHQCVGEKGAATCQRGRDYARMVRRPIAASVVLVQFRFVQSWLAQAA